MEDHEDWLGPKKLYDQYGLSIWKIQRILQGKILRYGKDFVIAGHGKVLISKRWLMDYLDQ